MKVKRRKLKRKAPFIICCLLLIALLAGGYELFKNDFFLPEFVGDDVADVAEGHRLNVLLLGVDARKGETMARSDTLILASVDTKSKQMSLLSIPRDTRVNIPKHGWDKINAADALGGPEMSMKVVSDLLGIPVKYYVQANFNGFKNIVDALGGVTLDVEQNMYHEDPDDGGAYEINLRKGVQRLDGDKALQYVRYREYAMGDIDRTTHQQRFLVALAKEMLQPSTILKLPTLVPEINKHVKTNLSVSDMVTLASAGKKLENGNIVAQTLPGRPLNIDGGSYWGVDPAEAKQMVAKLFNGETVTNVVLTSPLSGQSAGTESSSQAAPTIQSEIGVNPAIPQQSASGQLSGTTQTTAKPGQGTKSGASSTSGSTGTVTITPVDESESGTTSGKTDSSSGTQKDTGTSNTGQSGASQDSSTDGYNPGIPGSTKTSPGQT